MGGGQSKKPHAIRKDNKFDFELQPFLLGWEHEEDYRKNGLKLPDFDLQNSIGISMFGFVAIAKHRASQKFVACKVLRKKDVIRFQQVLNMQLEREVMSQLNHPMIARCGGAFQDATRLYLIVELCPGGDLYTHIQRQTNRKINDKSARFYAANVIVAIDYLHNRDLVYRALNSENCLIDADGYLKLVDFQQVAGVVERPNRGKSEFTGKRLKKREYWTAGEHPGPELVHKTHQESSFSEVYTHHRRRTAPQYFAPEVVNLKRHGKSVDWWSLGVLISEMLCGYPPFEHSEPSGLYHKILRLPVELPAFVMPITRDLILRLLDKDQRLLYKRQVPPFVPNLVGPTDTRYFLEYPTTISDRALEGDTKAGALFKGYDDIEGPPITLLPPRHCMYTLTPGQEAEHPEEQAAAQEEDEEKEEGEEEGDEEGEDGKKKKKKKKKKKQVQSEALEKADQECINRLAQQYGVTQEQAIKALKDNKYNEDKAGEALEKLMNLDDEHMDLM